MPLSIRQVVLLYSALEAPLMAGETGKTKTIMNLIFTGNNHSVVPTEVYLQHEFTK